jgi:hypothetical protein
MSSRYCPNEFPQGKGPGLYAVFLKKHSTLPDFEVDDEPRLLYIGKSESSIEARNHCSYASSSPSILRRSLGAILKHKLKLSAISRGFKKNGGPKDFQNFRFDEKGEARLSKWMLRNLEFSYLRLEKNIKEIRESEHQWIKRCNPPLNIQISKHEMRMKLADLRKICRDEASKW